MNQLLLLGGLATMTLSAGATLLWSNTRELAALDNAHLAGLLDADGRVALEGRSFLASAGSTDAKPAASSAPRGLPTDPNAPTTDAIGGPAHQTGEHETSRTAGLAPPVLGDDGHYSVDFAHLLFADYDPPELRDPEKPQLELAEFPEVVQNLHQKQVTISGFMIAVDWKDRKIERFLLGRFPPGCCFGMVPLFDEWIEVDNSEAGGLEYSAFETITVRGTLDAGEVLDDDGYVLSLYRLKATSVKPLY